MNILGMATDISRGTRSHGTQSSRNFSSFQRRCSTFHGTFLRHVWHALGPARRSCPSRAYSAPSAHRFHMEPRTLHTRKSLTQRAWSHTLLPRHSHTSRSPVPAHSPDVESQTWKSCSVILTQRTSGCIPRSDSVMGTWGAHRML